MNRLQVATLAAKKAGMKMGNIKSHELANDMHRLADALLVNPEFETDSSSQTIYMFFHSKEQITAFAKSLSSLGIEKEYTDETLRLKAGVGSIGIQAKINRNKVCRIVEPARPAVYDCEPLLSPEEDAALMSREAL